MKTMKGLVGIVSAALLSGSIGCFGDYEPKIVSAEQRTASVPADCKDVLDQDIDGLFLKLKCRDNDGHIRFYRSDGLCHEYENCQFYFVSYGVDQK
jgi:hypothetical protein